jgi:hypothetical protein
MRICLSKSFRVYFLFFLKAFCDLNQMAVLLIVLQLETIFVKTSFRYYEYFG